MFVEALLYTEKEKETSENARVISHALCFLRPQVPQDYIISWASGPFERLGAGRYYPWDFYRPTSIKGQLVTGCSNSHVYLVNL